jgi:shikimate dehydrogenase
MVSGPSPESQSRTGEASSSWRGPSVLVGLVGTGIQASRTPALHEREGTEQGLRYVYKLIDLEALGLNAGALPETLTAAQRFGFAGLNITHPCKQSVIPLLDELSPDAAALGAVNTVVLKDGRRVGHNTDWWGFAESFRRELSDVRINRVVQFGAGGAGAAVAHALLSLGAGEVTLVDTDEARAKDLAAGLCERFGGHRARAGAAVPDAMAAADGMVNTTPLGMAKYPGMAVPADQLRPDLWVADIVYFPLETELLRKARALGCRTMSGGGMAVFQAVGAFRLFTGLEANPERMLRHFSEM